MFPLAPILLWISTMVGGFRRLEIEEATAQDFPIITLLTLVCSLLGVKTRYYTRDKKVTLFYISTLTPLRTFFAPYRSNSLCGILLLYSYLEIKWKM